MAINGSSSSGQSDSTLHVRFRENADEQIEETLAALDRGETPEPYFEVVFHDAEDIHRVTQPQNLELLRTIVQHAPESIRETARLVDRDVRPVHRNLTELADLHLIELVDDGQAKRPHVWYDAIELDLPLGEPADASDEAQA